MSKIVAVSFVSLATCKLSALSANKMSNLNPIPDEIVFITPDVDHLKEVHKSTLTTTIPHRYISDQEAFLLCQVAGTIDGSLGWLPRQWVQLHLDMIIPSTDYILTCDSDLIVNRPLDLFTDGKINLFVESEYYEPYFNTIKTLLPGLTTFLPKWDSFNSEIMLLVPAELEKIRRAMNIKYYNWISLCLDVPVGTTPAFSEYETIGTWMLNTFPNNINLVKSDTYLNNMKFGRKSSLFEFQHKLSDLLATESVIPLRSIVDTDIDWNN